MALMSIQQSNENESQIYFQFEYYQSHTDNSISTPIFLSLSPSLLSFFLPPLISFFPSYSSLLLSVLTCWAIFLSVISITAAVLSAAAADKAQESSNTEHGQDY